MTPEEMRANSSKKIKQLQDLADTLHVSIEARDKVMNTGFIEKVIVFIDNEKYPTAPAPAPAPVVEVQPEEAAPTPASTEEEQGA